MIRASFIYLHFEFEFLTSVNPMAFDLKPVILFGDYLIDDEKGIGLIVEYKSEKFHPTSNEKLM